MTQDRHPRGQRKSEEDHKRIKAYKSIVSGEITVAGDITADISPKLIEALESSNEASSAQDAINNRRENRRFFVERITLFLVFAVACFNIAQIYLAFRASQFSKDNAESTSRAYVFVSNADIIGGKDGKDYSILFDFKNYGNSVARHVNIQNISSSMIAVPQQGTFAIIGYPPPQWPSQYLGEVPPGAERPIYIPITRERVAQINGNEKSVGLIAEIHYFDVFGKDHMTRLCQYAKYRIQSAVVDDKYIFAQCGNHNCDDDDCKND